jgi:hypothetical protein
MINLINQARAARGLPPLSPSVQLGNAALGHARDMATHPGMSHIGSDGSDGGDRILAEGYNWNVPGGRWGEVVGWGFNGDPAAMLQWWQQSQAHAPYIYATDVDEIGVGYAYAPASSWGHYWTCNTGRRAGGPVAPPPEPEPCPPTTPPVVDAPPVTSSPKGVDLLPYLRGDGRAYRVGNAWGSYEVFQSRTEGDRFYQVKAWDDLSVVHGEEFILSGSTIGRDIDTSPGSGRFYRQFGAPWVARYMAVGQSYTSSKRIQFYNLDDCSESDANSGNVTDTITLVAHHASYTFPSNGWEPVRLADVVQLRWNGGEDYFYARGYGMVGWARVHQDANSPAWSAICEMRPDVGRLQRLVIDCL